MKPHWSRREFLKTTTAAVVLGAANKALRAAPAALQKRPWQNRRNGFLHRFWLRHPLLFN